jgi:hypothetical protein
MAPFYQTYSGNAIHLHQDDISALRHLYGKNAGGHDSSSMSKFKPEKTGFDLDTPDSYEEDAEVHDIKPDICDDPSLDAITVIGNGTTYAFKGTLHKLHAEFRSSPKTWE